MIKTQFGSHYKIGIHVNAAGRKDGFGDWLKALTNAGIPAFIKATDEAGPAFEAQELAKSSGVPHVIVFRRSTVGSRIPDPEAPGRDIDFDRFNRDKSNPVDAGRQKWEQTKAHIPKELDPNYVILELANEEDRNVYDWLFNSMTEAAMLANAEGWSVAGVASNSGEPEPDAWETPGALRYLRYCQDNPGKAFVSVHEYLWDWYKNFPTQEQTWNKVYPDLIGRFEVLYATCARHGIRRPPLLITEFGFEHRSTPDYDQVNEILKNCANLYARYPEVLGTATWTLGNYQGSGVDTDTIRLLPHLRDDALNWQYNGTVAVDPVLSGGTVDGGGTTDGGTTDGGTTDGGTADGGGSEAPAKPSPTTVGTARAPYDRIVHVFPGHYNMSQKRTVFDIAQQSNATVSGSYDDAGLGAGLTSKRAVLHGIPAAKRQEFLDWYETHYPDTIVEFFEE